MSGETEFACLLSGRGVIRLGGADRRNFLQGLISNDIDLCKADRAIHAGFLTPQGKFLHDLFVVENGEEFLIDCEAARAEDLLKRLAAYKLRAKVTMADASAEFEVWGFGVQGSGFGVQGAFADPRLPELGLRAILKQGNPRTPNPDPRTLYDRHRLALGVADGRRDMLVEKSTLAEGNFDLLNGISWSKGCYVGQELTARMHYRGLAKKRLYPVTIEGPAPAPGSILKIGDQEAGEMRSSSGNLGLALLNIEKAEMAVKENILLSCGESRLGVSKPAWMNLNPKS